MARRIRRAAAALASLCRCRASSSIPRASFVPPCPRRSARGSPPGSEARPAGTSLLTLAVGGDVNEKQQRRRHSILDDGRGHINGELATAIYEWELSSGFLAAGDGEYGGGFSTRDGLRLVEGLAGEFHGGEPGGKGYNDLVQVRGGPV